MKEKKLLWIEERSQNYKKIMNNWKEISWNQTYKENQIFRMLNLNLKRFNENSEQFKKKRKCFLKSFKNFNMNTNLLKGNMLKGMMNQSKKKGN